MKKYLEYGQHVFKALSILYQDANYRKYSVKSLLSYSEYFNENSDTSIFEKDITAFTTYFSDLLSCRRFEDCEILNHFQNICHRYNVICPEMLMSYKGNDIFLICLAIKEERIGKDF
jgi:predicted unusual protein kinase regulating ubiquinone biosynthesis (AarF/ABC1/UbiB family)